MRTSDTSTLSNARRIVRFATIGLATMLLVLATASAQNGADRFRVGVYGYGSLVNHAADFRTLPGVGCCGPGFDGGSGFGTGSGFLLQMPLLANLALQMRAGYATIGGEMTRDEHIGNALKDESAIDAFSRHRITSTLNLITLEPSLSIRPFRFPLAFNIGGELGYVTGSSYEQDETLTTPSDATFSNGARVRNQSSGAVPDASSFRIAATGGVSYDIAASKNIVITPEVSYSRQFNGIVKDSSWSAHGIRFGASIAFQQATRTAGELVDAGVLTASVSAVGVHADGAVAPMVQMRVEEFMSARLRPLLNYVFFDQGSSSLPVRYRTLDRASSKSFAVDQLHNRDVIDTYHDVLNIVGRRLADDPKATIRLVGCNNGSEDENGNTSLSRSRAEAVRDYLRSAWGINDSRMKIESRNLPEVPSNVADADGLAENRRVEIIADRRAITAPVVTNDTIRRSDPPAIRFSPNAATDAGVASWTLVASQSGRVLREFKGRGEVPSTIEWNLAGESEAMPRSSQPIEYRLDVVDNDGRDFSTPTSTIPIEQITLQRKRAERLADREIDRFSLILFDFGRADIDGANKSIIEQISKRISKKSFVEIAGHTDRVGDEELNHNLSRDRAMNVARQLGVGYENARGLGESPEMFDNDLPEGRFYCRIVDVTVETPVNQ